MELFLRLEIIFADSVQKTFHIAADVCHMYGRGLRCE